MRTWLVLAAVVAAGCRGRTKPEVVPVGHLAALCRLWVELEAERGRDPVPLAVNLMARAFEGRLPILFAQRMLEQWTAKWWTFSATWRSLRHLMVSAASIAASMLRSDGR